MWEPSISGEVRNKNFLRFLRLYHDFLITTVNQFGSILQYTFEELVEDFGKSALHGLAFAMGPLATVLSEKEDIHDLDDFTQGMKDLDMESEEGKAFMQKEVEHMEKMINKNTSYKQRVQDIWEELIDNGIL